VPRGGGTRGLPAPEGFLPVTGHRNGTVTGYQLSQVCHLQGLAVTLLSLFFLLNHVKGVNALKVSEEGEKTQNALIFTPRDLFES